MSSLTPAIINILKTEIGEAVFIYELETPIETPLSAEELAQYAALHTNYLSTTIYNDAGAYMEVKYEKGTDLDGAVWITTGTHSTVAFNALKKGEIYVYPASAKVYTADGWVTRQAMTWQNGDWKVWKLALYSHGDECVDITGGWVAAPAPDTYSQGGSKTPSVSRNADNIVVSLSGTGANVGGKLQTAKAVDLTPYTKLLITCTGSGQGQWSGAGLQIYNQSGSSVARISISGVQTDREVDLSNINGDCYVSCFVGTSGTGTLSASMTVYSITLE